jgi:hypothetical protein
MFSGIATQGLFRPPYLITISGSGPLFGTLPSPAELSGNPGSATVHYKKFSYEYFPEWSWSPVRTAPLSGRAFRESGTSHGQL